MPNTLLEINNLDIKYTTSKLGKKEVIQAVNSLSLTINEGEIIAIAGESGCGKSTLSKAIIKLIDINSGEIIYQGNNIIDFDKQQIQEYRKKVQMIFQNPYASLNPKMTIESILSEPLVINTRLSKAEILDIVKEKIKQVGLSESHLGRYPHEFSGGQRQRIAIARALMLNPEFIIADEPVSALDASIQAQIINLIKDLKEKYQMTIMFISHDLNVIRYIADRIGIMYLGELVEIGTKDEIFSNPQHPYTKLLLDSIPSPDKQPENVNLLELPIQLPLGCKFYDRCSEPNCEYKNKKPEYKIISPTHKVMCGKL